MKVVVCRILLSIALIAATWTAGAQELLRPAAVVNDEVISVLDLDMRIRLAILATGQEDSPDLRRRVAGQVMRALIDERLQGQEAARLDIEVSGEQVADAVEQLAQRNNMSRDQFFGLLESRGVLPQTLEDQVRAQLLWRTLVARRLRPSVVVSSEEVEEVVNRIVASQGTTQRRVAEIFLGVDSALAEADVRAAAQRLFDQLLAGADFAALARQFSESATAPRGGDIGWEQKGQLAEELDTALAQMQPGTIAGPIRTLSGYHILYLREQRQTPATSTTLNLSQVLFPLPAEATAEQRQQARGRAAQVRDGISGCTGLDELARQEGGPGSGDLGSLELADLPQPVQDAVRTLPVGQPSQPVEVEGGLSVLVVCARSNPGIDRERIREQLVEERLDMLARRYMRDLRRAANVDIRI